MALLAAATISTIHTSAASEQQSFICSSGHAQSTHLLSPVALHANTEHAAGKMPQAQHPHQAASNRHKMPAAVLSDAAAAHPLWALHGQYRTSPNCSRTQMFTQ
jgi:hypothetical protein